MQKAIIIGAGISGIATSIRLAAKGYKVEVYESNSYPGGKLTSIDKDGFRFDAGPSLFTLPNLVDELFELCSESPRLHFNYSKKETICNYFWDDGQRYQMPSDRRLAVPSLSTAFDESQSSISSYLESNKRKYQVTYKIFIEQSLHKLTTYLSLDTIKALLNIPSLGIFKSLNDHNTSTFKNRKLIQLFDRYATYNGSSPYLTPSIMSMIPHLEMDDGTYFPEGGMQSITNSLVALAERQGVTFYYGQKVDEIIIRDRRAIGIILRGRAVFANVVVSNMDIYSTYKQLLPTQKTPKRTLSQERSSSALIFYWGIKGVHLGLDLHNILFSNNYQQEFDYIFRQKDIYDDPTIYINISSKCNPKDAPLNCENWFVMINTSSDEGQDWSSLISRARKNIIKKINHNLSIDLEKLIITEDVLDPRSIASKTASYKGSLYGTSSNNRYAAFLRHPNFSRSIENLFFVGGSVHPGGGIPLCLNSAKIVSNFL